MQTRRVHVLPGAARPTLDRAGVAVRWHQIAFAGASDADGEVALVARAGGGRRYAWHGGVDVARVHRPLDTREVSLADDDGVHGVAGREGWHPGGVVAYPALEGALRSVRLSLDVADVGIPCLRSPL